MILIYILPFFLGALAALPQNHTNFSGGPNRIINVTVVNFHNSSGSSLPTTTTTVRPSDESGVQQCYNVVKDDGIRTSTVVANDGSFHRNTLTLALNPETGFLNITSMSGIFTIVDKNTDKLTALQYTADERGFRVAYHISQSIPTAALASLAGGGIG